jgi:hypothetical protein
VKLPVFVFKKLPRQMGDGYYKLTACFVKLGIHITYTIYCHSENEYLESIERPKLCDDSCCTIGHMEDFNRKRSDSEYAVKKLIDLAKLFKKKKSLLKTT